jgi:(2R)-3-sulfolactate dehydrogenase (NADP+)
MAVALTGSSWSFTASSFADDLNGPPNVDQFILAFNPTLFGSDNYLNRIEELFSEILNQKGTQLPCDERLAARIKTKKEGVIVDEPLLSKLKSYLA